MAFVSAAIKPSTEHLHPRGVMFVHERPLEVETGIEMTVCLLFFVVCIFPSLYTLVWYPIQSKYGAGIADTDIDSDDRNKVSIPSHYYQCYRFLDQSAHLYYTHATHRPSAQMLGGT